MTQDRGHSIALSLPRRLICDLLHFARKVPSVPVQRRVDVAGLRDARSAGVVRPSWCTLFLKAYGLVAGQMPELRRAYLSWPWPRLYETPFNVASVSLRRKYRGENAIFFAHFLTPERQSLADLESHLRRFKEAPLESIGVFRRGAGGQPAAAAVAALPLVDGAECLRIQTRRPAPGHVRAERLFLPRGRVAPSPVSADYHPQLRRPEPRWQP